MFKYITVKYIKYLIKKAEKKKHHLDNTDIPGNDIVSGAYSNIIKNYKSTLIFLDA